MTASAAALALPAAGGAAATTPWYRRTYRWGQTNITEKDPVRYDIAWWREYWKRTETQGVIVNAGGIVAYYPSKFPLHHRAEFLGDRDLYGELAKAAHDDGLVVLARMDCNRVAEDFYKAHPDWFARNSSGNPYRAADKYVTCINSPYYDEYIPGVLTEIIERSHPEGFTDNSWAGLGRDSICYCANCERKFRDKTGAAAPQTARLERPGLPPVDRLELRPAAGGLGPVQPHHESRGRPGLPLDRHEQRLDRGPVANLPRHQADLRARRDDDDGSPEPLATRPASSRTPRPGKLIHGCLGWDKIVPESMAMYQAGRNSFRLASKPAAEARMWMIAGFAGGIQPWWHHIGAYHEDRRMYRTAEPVMRWHKANEQYLVNRRPVATVGLVWSQRNTDFYGRDNADELAEAPYRGFMQALVRARIPYIPVHVDHIERGGRQSRRADSAEPGGHVGRAVRRGAALCRARRRADRHRAPPACTTSGATRAAISRWRICSARTRGGAGRRECAHDPHLSAADSRAARGRLGTQGRRRAAGHRSAPPRAAPASTRPTSFPSAACSSRCAPMRMPSCR